MEKIKFKASSSDFSKIPGSPIAYWVSGQVFNVFETSNPLSTGDFAKVVTGMTTAGNENYLRLWHEIRAEKFTTKCLNNAEAAKSSYKWFPYQKGGDFRRWYGNNEFVVNWENDGHAIKNNIDTDTGKVRSGSYNPEYVFSSGLTWTYISSSNFGVRFVPAGYLFDNKGSMIFCSAANDSKILLGYLCTKLAFNISKILNPTLSFQPGDMARVPVPVKLFSYLNIAELSANCISISKSDWDSFETSWDFTSLPLLSANYRGETLADTYSNIRAFWQNQTDEMKRLEEENNRIFIDAYGLNDELTPDVPLKEITITCNPHYRYGDVDNLEGRLLFDTIQEFIHYGVGCMFGRYSLDKEGLILANQGETQDDYLAKIPNPSFMPDADNVLSILSKDYFEDDIATRFNEFLRITFGKEKFTENLAFIENTLADNKAGKNIREYFQKSFFNYHVKRFKKRPIYWQFESPKGSFKALIYMHRYKPDQVSVILNDYLREFNNKITHEIESNQAILITGNDIEKIKAQKEIDRLIPILRETSDWERDIIFPLAQARIEIDLDDGVKTNYPKFGKALTKIVGLDTKEE
ncbi:MAG: BREX-1 system adenine-specific DNA-methyltransferase PglX [Caulobacterales bacterium]|nr:BREX-1 system adenine-specific DNA-methyltransferase PglX [Caulobacterales bacterium]